jgi:hypothetical protein
MNGFKLWLLVLESGRFDHAGFNALFRRQLAELLPRVHDDGRRVGLDALRDFDFVAYILAALRNAGFRDQQEREQAAHDLIVQLLVSPGQLFAGYAATSGPLEARFRLSVQNGVRTLLRGQRRRQRSSRAVSIGHEADELPAHAIPDRRHDDALDDEVMTAFRNYLADALGEDAVALFDRRLDGVSLRQLVRDPAFNGSSAWTLRRLMRNVRDAALAFARRHGDDEFLAAVERLTAG